ncbi:alpha/beta hydrolase [Pedococcus aerophilus]|uniref:alpha/beta hydrolase n=1 Tax=Pedococcus aerophilus TaxID=436356 RepID=UPI0031D875A3
MPAGVLAVVLLAGCGGSGPSEGATARPSTPTPTPGPTSVSDRCKVPVDGGELVEIADPGGSVMTGATLGEGPVVAVYLHQTTPVGFCGWTAYAAWAAERGVRAVLVDLCGWGRSRCTGGLAIDPAAQVRLVVDWARSRGATRVTLVGASLGGVTALAVGQQSGADALVDLSGPFSYPGLDTAAVAAPRTTLPLLLAVAPGDTDVQPAELKAAFESAPAKVKKFVSTPRDHGWGMLNDGTDADPDWTPLADTVLAWTKGDYTGA